MTGSVLAHVVLDLYLGEFAAVHDGYVLDSHIHKNEPLTPDVAEWALLNGHSISGYMADVQPDGITTQVGAIDLDEGSMADGKRVRDLLQQHSIPSLLVESRRGCHVWTFHSGDGTHGSTIGHPVSAAAVRGALRAAAALCGLDGPKVEVFPKASASRWGVGALRMPLMPHPKTGEKYPAYDMDGTKIDKVTDLVNAIADMTAPYSNVHVLSGVDTEPVPYPTGASLGPYRQQRPDRGEVPTVSELLAQLGVLTQGKRAVRCPWHEDDHASLSIAPDDERVWCKSPSCPTYNGGRGMGSLALRSFMQQAHV